MLQYKNWLGYVADVTSIGDLIFNVTTLRSLQKKQKRNLFLTIGIHVAVSTLAVSVSAVQTKKIVNSIKEVK